MTRDVQKYITMTKKCVIGLLGRIKINDCLMFITIFIDFVVSVVEVGKAMVFSVAIETNQTHLTRRLDRAYASLLIG